MTPRISRLHCWCHLLHWKQPHSYEAHQRSSLFAGVCRLFGVTLHSTVASLHEQRLIVGRKQNRTRRRFRDRAFRRDLTSRVAGTLTTTGNMRAYIRYMPSWFGVCYCFWSSKLRICEGERNDIFKLAAPAEPGRPGLSAITFGMCACLWMSWVANGGGGPPNSTWPTQLSQSPCTGPFEFAELSSGGGGWVSRLMTLQWLHAGCDAETLRLTWSG